MQEGNVKVRQVRTPTERLVAGENRVCVRDRSIVKVCGIERFRISFTSAEDKATSHVLTTWRGALKVYRDLTVPVCVKRVVRRQNARRPDARIRLSCCPVITAWHIVKHDVKISVLGE